MFDEEPKGNVEDIFGDTPNAPAPSQDPGNKQNVMPPRSTAAPSSQKANSQIPEMAMPAPEQPAGYTGTVPQGAPPILETGSVNAKRIVMIAAGVLVIGIGGGAVWWYTSRNTGSVADEASMTQAQEEENTDIPVTPPSEEQAQMPPTPIEPEVREEEEIPPEIEPEQEPEEEPEVVIPPPVIPVPEPPSDTDHDGLTDEEEIMLGTNPSLVDTDRDGLFDYEEVKVYKTDPRKSDTDGDGFTDGQEVKNGYNPNGPGSLSDIDD